eukprot:m.55861 g.55861  ORF g.55861 m.55861 type:complete len:428 (-) comp22147_c0_seq1:244-1527(-)
MGKRQRDTQAVGGSRRKPRLQIGKEVIEEEEEDLNSEEHFRKLFGIEPEPEPPQAAKPAVTEKQPVVEAVVAKPVLPVEKNEPELPSGWEQCLDPSSGGVYFWNTETNEVTWSRPVAEILVVAKTEKVKALTSLVSAYGDSDDDSDAHDSDTNSETETSAQPKVSKDLTSTSSNQNDVDAKLAEFFNEIGVETDAAAPTDATTTLTALNTDETNSTTTITTNSTNDGGIGSNSSQGDPTVKPTDIVNDQGNAKSLRSIIDADKRSKRKNAIAMILSKHNTNTTNDTTTVENNNTPNSNNNSDKGAKNNTNANANAKNTPNERAKHKHNHNHKNDNNDYDYDDDDSATASDASLDDLEGIEIEGGFGLNTYNSSSDNHTVDDGDNQTTATNATTHTQRKLLLSFLLFFWSLAQTKYDHNLLNLTTRGM